MKKYTFIILGAFVAFSLFSVVNAQGTTTPATTTQASSTAPKPKPLTRPALLKDKLEEKNVKAGERMQSVQERMDEKANKALKTFVSKRNEQASKIAEKLGAEVKNLKVLSEKLNSFITQAKAKGAETTKLSESLAAANSKIAEAETKIAAIVKISDSETEITKEKAAEVRKSMKDAETAVRNARKALSETAQMIRKAAAQKEFMPIKKSETTPAVNNSQEN